MNRDLAKERRMTGKNGRVTAMKLCKQVINHAWDFHRPLGMRRPAFGTRVTLRCDRCATLRHDIVGRRDGGLLARYYEHPDGYKDIERVVGDARRKLLIKMSEEAR